MLDQNNRVTVLRTANGFAGHHATDDELLHLVELGLGVRDNGHAVAVEHVVDPLEGVLPADVLHRQRIAAIGVRHPGLPVGLEVVALYRQERVKQRFDILRGRFLRYDNARWGLL